MFILLIKISLILVSIFVSYKLFRAASGGLSIQNINTISITFYCLLIFCYIGSCLIFLGYKENYYISLTKKDTTNLVFAVSSLSIVIIPLLILFFNKMMGIHDYKQFYNSYVSADVQLSDQDESIVYYCVVFWAIICTVSLAYTFYHVGHIPFFELLKGNFSFAEERVTISREFTGNYYLRNIFALGLTPNLAILSYIYYKKSKNKYWRIIFWLLFFLALSAKTYDYSKSPIVKFLLEFLFVDIILGNRNYYKGALIALLGFILLLSFYYFLENFSGSILTLSRGPIGRVFISQIAGFYLCFEAFPRLHEFLLGSSFSKSIALIFGLNEYGIRSGRVVMETFFWSNVQSGKSDVMNTFFEGEAYANFGYAGLIISVFVVSFLISVLPNYILKQRKNPLNITLYIYISFTYVNGLFGGFVDYIYSAQTTSICIILLIIKQLSNNHTKISNQLENV